ncbi:hypothetical protein NL676_006995 [Syzygium grande]|nr:hypothetical protein NL676_006995 [Syzygium grande]
MQQPGKPTAALPEQEERAKAKAAQKLKKSTKMPSPEELLSHYESRGLDSHQASLQAIDDLQKLLSRVLSSRGAAPPAKADRGSPPDLARKMDAASGRLALLEMKLDSKPGYAEAFAIGVGSGAALNGMGSLMPHLLSSLSQIWSSVTNPHHHQ